MHSFKQYEPLFPLETTAAGATPAIDAGICLSARAKSALDSSLSFFSLAITRQAASCWKWAKQASENQWVHDDHAHERRLKNKMNTKKKKEEMKRKTKKRNGKERMEE